MKKSILILLIVFATWNTEAQTLNSSVKGSIGISKRNTRQASVKVILSSFFYSDTIILDKNTDNFVFKKVPYGIYELKIDANRGRTGLKDFIVEDILINKEVVVLDTIFLFPDRSCGSKSEFWVYEYSLQQKEPKEYYPTGELYGEGNYFLVKKYFRKEKSNMYCYRKDGIWKYYDKNGNLLECVRYEKDEPQETVGFYENGSIKFKMIFSNNTCYVEELLYFNMSGEILFRVKFTLNSINTPTMKIKYEFLSGYSENNQLIEGD